MALWVTEIIAKPSDLRLIPWYLDCRLGEPVPADLPLSSKGMHMPLPTQIKNKLSATILK